jgi:hypothetical protein
MNKIATISAGMLRTNLRGQIRQTQLPKWKALLPLFEAVMNSFQAIQDAESADRDHRITIVVERRDDLFDIELPPIAGFEVTDTGVGFDDDNFDSFNTAYSEHKFDRGGKGLGRFMWLKAFDQVSIKSTFLAQDSDEAPAYWRRDFRFGFDYDPDKVATSRTDRGPAGTTVRLSGFKSPYREECPASLDTLALRLAEHFVLVLMQPDCPEVQLHDQGIRLSLNQVFREHFRKDTGGASFSVTGQQFRIDGFRLTAPRASKHRLIYAANSRSVVTEMLDQHIPNLVGRLVDPDGNSFVYLAVVQGDYLNEKVNNARTDFEMREESEEGQLELQTDEEIRLSAIRAECVDYVQKDLSDLIESLNKAKIERIVAFVRQDAPHYKPILRYIGDFVDSISPGASKTDIELALHRELHKREVALKRESSKVLTEAAKLEDYEGYRNRLSEFMERSNELGQSALAQYVMHRKIVIELLDKALSSDRKTERYPLEQAVHNILFPMRSTDRETLYSQQNLWLLDERLNYHSFIASDKPLNGLDEFDSESRKRPDLFIFDRRIAFAEGAADGAPISSVTVVEFKRPQRDDYTELDNPLTQVIEQIQLIRGGQFKNDAGRPIPVAGERIPAFAYVVCDITPKLRSVLVDRDAKGTPDGLSYYGYHSNHGIYYEVIDYGRLLTDAKRRNRAFFDRLNLLDGDRA